MAHKTLPERSEEIFGIISAYAEPDDVIMEIGCGDGGHLKYLKERGFKNLIGFDRDTDLTEDGITAIRGTLEECVDTLPKADIVYSASCLFLIPDIETVKRVQRLARKYLMTFEGEVDAPPTVFGRDYSKVFTLEQVFHKPNLFNIYGHARVFKA